MTLNIMVLSNGMKSDIMLSVIYAEHCCAECCGTRLDILLYLQVLY